MEKASLGRMCGLAVLLLVACIWTLATEVTPTRLTLILTLAVASVTTIYALLTFEILLQNQKMARASVDSATIMERTLRFSQSAKLLFQTITTKDPSFDANEDSTKPIDNSDYRRALAEISSGEQREFVFAVIQNKGQSAATNVQLSTTYAVTDSSNPNRESTVTKTATVPILGPNSAVALCVFISKVPTRDDEVRLVEAQVMAGDFYKDALEETPSVTTISPRNHNVVQGADCVIRLS